MSTSITLDSSPSRDVESWNHEILSFQLDDSDPETFDRRIEQSLAALFDPEEFFGDPSASCDTFHCSSYFPIQ